MAYQSGRYVSQASCHHSLAAADAVPKTAHSTFAVLWHYYGSNSQSACQQLVYLGASILGTGILMKWLTDAMDPHREQKAQVSQTAASNIVWPICFAHVQNVLHVQAAKKVKGVEQRLGVPLTDMTTHELVSCLA